MLKLKRAGIQPGREVLLGAVEGGVRVFGGTADGAGGEADDTDADAQARWRRRLPAEVASHVFVSRELGRRLFGDRSVTMTRWNEGVFDGPAG